MSVERLVKFNPAPLPRDVQLRATSRLADVVGFESALKVLNETHFTTEADQRAAAVFVQNVGNWLAWREVVVYLHADALTWNEHDLEELLVFALCVSYVWVVTGGAWHPKEPSELTTRLCGVLGIKCSAALSPDARTKTPDDQEAEILHQRPDQ